MNTLSADVVGGQLVALLAEAFEVPADAPYTLFNDKGTGFSQVLGGVSAADASRAVGSNTVAGQTAHVILGLKAVSHWVRTKSMDVDWSNPYPGSAVDEAAWAKLRADLRVAYDGTAQAIREKAAAGPEEFAGAVGAVAHAAYHLGQVRKMLAVLKAG
ncbi:MAG: hypothetical protein K2X87_18275 [Gemmataceae bacterium]|nr:hypothetical protein [Gemmataceae bacterium]